MTIFHCRNAARYIADDERIPHADRVRTPEEEAGHDNHYAITDVARYFTDQFGNKKQNDK